MNYIDPTGHVAVAAGDGGGGDSNPPREEPPKPNPIGCGAMGVHVNTGQFSEMIGAQPLCVATLTRQVQTTQWQCGMVSAWALFQTCGYVTVTKTVSETVYYVAGSGGSGGGNGGSGEKEKHVYAKQSAYVSLRNRLGGKAAAEFMESMNKGFVGPYGQNGIKVLSGNGVKIGNTAYKYEVKVFNNELANYRLYGNYDSNGNLVFTLFDRAQHR